MSTDFLPDGQIAFDALRAFNHGGVHTHSVDDDDTVHLTDGKENYLAAYPPSRTWPIMFERCGNNDPTRIVEAIEHAFSVHLVSEYDDDFDKIRRHRTR